MPSSGIAGHMVVLFLIPRYLFLTFKYICFIEVELTYNVSGAQQGDLILQKSNIILKLFSIIGYYKILTIVPMVYSKPLLLVAYLPIN